MPLRGFVSLISRCTETYHIDFLSEKVNFAFGELDRFPPCLRFHMRIPYEQAIERLGLLANLCSFDPVVIGTLPLGIDLCSSDIDIACSCDAFDLFADVTTRQFESQDGFQVRHGIFQEHASIVVQFNAHGWDVDIFCQPIPTAKQWGVRHFRVEQRLLALSPCLTSTVMELKRSGLKTEPAFAKALGLSGEPYEAILRLEHCDDRELLALSGMS